MRKQLNRLMKQLAKLAAKWNKDLMIVDMTESNRASVGGFNKVQQKSFAQQKFEQLENGIRKQE